MYTYVCVYSRAYTHKYEHDFTFRLCSDKAGNTTRAQLKKRNSKVLNGYTYIALIYYMV